MEAVKVKFFPVLKISHNGVRGEWNGFGGLVISMLASVPEFAGSNPAEAVGFFWCPNKSSACLPSEGK